jgi:hypothetical protein
MARHAAAGEPGSGMGCVFWTIPLATLLKASADWVRGLMITS